MVPKQTKPGLKDFRIYGEIWKTNQFEGFTWVLTTD